MSREYDFAGPQTLFEGRSRFLAKVETYFLHSPDPGTPIEQTVDGMQLVYASGKYKHVGQTCIVHCTRMLSSEAYVEAYVVDSLVSRTLSRKT